MRHIRHLIGLGLMAAALGTACLSPATAQRFHPFVNGSFERGPQPGGFVTLAAGSRAIYGWVVTRATIDVIGGYWRASNGNISIDLDGTPGAGAIAQTFATAPGRRYVVRFDLSANPECGPAVKQMRVAAAGYSGRYWFNSAMTQTPNMHYVRHRFVFVARSYATTLEFRSLDPDGGNCGPVLDNVSVH